MTRSRGLALLVAAAVCPSIAALSQPAAGAAVTQAAVAVPQLPKRAAAPTGNPMTSDPAAPATSPFAQGGVWRTDVRQAPLDPRSPAMASNLTKQVTSLYGGVAAFNVWNWNANYYRVPADQQRVNVIWDDCQHKGWTPPGLYGTGGQFVSVPIPSNARPAGGSDATLTVYQSATDTLWDFWQAAKKADGWHACWGGRLDGVSKGPGHFQGNFGATASGLPWAAGQIGIKEVQAGRIEHAVALQLFAPAMWGKVSWPAQRSDGWSFDAAAIPEGTHLRLDPRIDVGKLNIHPLAKMIAKAAQTYGFIVTDKSGSVAVVAESGEPTWAWSGVNPWEKILRGTPNWAVMRNFPWASIQVLPKDYGKPGVTAARSR